MKLNQDYDTSMFILFGIGEWIIMLTLLEVDRIKDPDIIIVFQQHSSCEVYDIPFWMSFVKNNIVSVAKITQKKEPILLDSFKVIARLTSGIIDDTPDFSPAIAVSS